MIDRLKKHSVKIFVFFLNILLAAGAVFAIWEDDKSRLEENALKNREDLDYQKDTDASSSFENKIKVELQEENPEAGVNSDDLNISNQSLPTNVENISPSTIPPADPIPSNTAPAPIQTKKPADRKTKTS